MKGFLSTLLLSLMLFTSMTGHAATVREKKFKEEMVKRADDLILKLDETIKELKTENVKVACTKIAEIFPIYKDHALDIGVRMDPFDNKSSEIRNDSLAELIMIDQEKLNCERGNDSEYVDAEALQKKLKSILRSVKKQKKVIEKKSTGFDNFYQYEYDFSA